VSDLGQHARGHDPVYGRAMSNDPTTTVDQCYTAWIGSEIKNLQQLLVSISRGGTVAQCKHRSNLLEITTTNSDRALINKQSDLKTFGEEQSVDQSIKNTRSDKPSNLIPHDKDQADDPMSFVPIFHSESNQIEIFQ
jgi:hypothetical protein